MSSFESFAAFIKWREVSGIESVFFAAFATSSASAEKSSAAPPIPNANTEAVPRMNFLSIVISPFQFHIQRTGWLQSRGVADRLLALAYVLLQRQTLFDPYF